MKIRHTNLQRKNETSMSATAICASFHLPLEQPLRRAPRIGALCRSALTRAFRPTFSFCMALRASLTEFTTFTMLIWLSDSSCNTYSGKDEQTLFLHNNYRPTSHPRLFITFQSGGAFCQCHYTVRYHMTKTSLQLQFLP